VKKYRKNKRGSGDRFKRRKKPLHQAWMNYYPAKRTSKLVQMQGCGLSFREVSEWNLDRVIGYSEWGFHCHLSSL